MKIDGEFTFQGSREKVWELLLDPQVIATVLPGTENLKQVNENEYQGDMQTKVGPISGVFNGKVVLSNKVAPERYNMSIDAKGNAGFLKGSGLVQLIAQPDGTTLLKYEIEADVGGPIASVGQRLMETVGKGVARTGLESLNSALQVRLGTKPKKAFEPPTTRRLAANIAKDVASRMNYRAIWIILLFVLLALVLWKFLK
jgi:carbon monoxide dehydrogenase subunit G